MDPALIQTILQECQIAYALTDRDLRVVKLDGAVALFGGDSPANLGCSLLELAPELAGQEAILARILAGRLPRLQMDWVKRHRSDGQIVYLRLMNLPYRDPTGQITGLIHLVIDTTEVGRLKVEMLQAQQLRVKQLDHDLEVAAEVQTSFTPRHLPQLPGYEFVATFLPASEIGGDFYDIFQADDGGLGIIVGDVAGKGISAALLAASVRATIRAELYPGGQPGQVLKNANAKLYQDLSRIERFATVTLVGLPAHDPIWRYANAGHTTAFWLQADPLRVQLLPSLTIPLGVLPDLEEDSIPLELQPHDVLVIYSDGLTEVENERGKILGQAGVTDVLLATHTAPAQFILNSLLEANQRHRGAVPVGDDLTVLVIKKAPEDTPIPCYLARLHLPGDLRVLPEVEAELARLQSYLPSTDWAATWLIEVQLAVTEAVSNVIRHAYAKSVGGIYGLIALYSHHLHIDLFDRGAAYQPQQITPLDFDPGDPPEGGYGLNIVYEVMDQVTYERQPHGYNHWRFIRRLPE